VSSGRTDGLDLLAQGDLRVAGLLPRASNYTFLAHVVANGRSIPVVYKPRDGETPLWDFPVGTLCLREVAAYRLASELGWPNVPPTILREGPHGVGAVQAFVDHQAGEHYFTLRDRLADEFRAVAAFDVLAGNGDRKSGHCLLAPDGRVWVVDHGLCFNRTPVLRTVIWDFAGEPVPAALADDVRRAYRALRFGPLRDELLELLSAEEVDATAERAAELVRSGVFPVPGPGRSHPWPQV
jgi:uncharacterized repeat protein (TIGR03843 family)